MFKYKLQLTIFFSHTWGQHRLLQMKSLLPLTTSKFTHRSTQSFEVDDAHVLVIYMQLLAQMDNCDWQEVTFQMKAEWKSAPTVSGVLCVMTPGEKQKLL